MKQYVLFLFEFILLGILFLFQNVPFQYALATYTQTQLHGKCGTITIMAGKGTVSQHWVCDQHQNWDCVVPNGTGQGTCEVKTNPSGGPQPSGGAQLLNCACINENVPGSGKNGFKCTTDTDLNTIRNSTASPAFCADSGDACHQTQDRVDINTIHFASSNYQKNSLQGIYCAPSKIIAYCKCTSGPTDQPGKFSCYSPGPPVNKDPAKGSESSPEFTGECQTTACQNTDNSLATDNTSLSNFSGDYKDHEIHGIKCADNIVPSVGASKDPPDPTEPPPPPPPCEKLAADGTCASFATGIGSIATDTAGFITKLFAILLSISGGIALFLIIRAGYTLMTSQGKPDQINQGREQIIAAIVGLLFLIFSFVILEIIGIDILRVPDLMSAGTPGQYGVAPGSPGSTCNTDADCKAAGDVCVKDASGGYGTCRLPVPSPNQGGPGTGQSCSCVGSSQLCKQIGGQQGNGGTCASPQVYCCY